MNLIGLFLLLFGIRTHLLVAGGRSPNTSGIGLDKAGVETTERGHVKVNERLQTTAGEVMTTVQMTMLAGSPYTALRDAIITHPTMTEGLIQLVLAVPAKTS